VTDTSPIESDGFGAQPDGPVNTPDRSFLDDLRASEAFVEPTADQLEERLFRRAEEPHDVPDERSSERHAWVTDLTITISDTSKIPRSLIVTSREISRGGFSFMFRQFIAPGTRVGVRINKLPARGVLHGVVRSCVHVGGIHHRIGVQFSSVA